MNTGLKPLDQILEPLVANIVAGSTHEIDNFVAFLMRNRSRSTCREPCQTLDVDPHP